MDFNIVMFKNVVLSLDFSGPRLIHAGWFDQGPLGFRINPLRGLDGTRLIHQFIEKTRINLSFIHYLKKGNIVILGAHHRLGCPDIIDLVAMILRMGPIDAVRQGPIPGRFRVTFLTFVLHMLHSSSTIWALFFWVGI